MPHVENRTTTVWICEICVRAHQTQVEAESCEKRHAKQLWDVRWWRLFPSHHQKDSRFIRYCVRCGLRLLEYQYLPDPAGRAETGNEIFRLVHLLIFEGRYCIPCADKVKDEILQAVQAWRARETEKP